MDDQHSSEGEYYDDDTPLCKGCRNYQEQKQRLEQRVAAAENDARNAELSIGSHCIARCKAEDRLQEMKQQFAALQTTPEFFEAKQKSRLVDAIAEVMSRLHFVGEDDEEAKKESVKDAQSTAELSEACTLCLEDYSNASAFAVYTCGHSVCLATCYAEEKQRYIDKYPDSNGMSLECHTCRQIIHIHEIVEDALSPTEVTDRIACILGQYIQDARAEVTAVREFIASTSVNTGRAEGLLHESSDYSTIDENLSPNDEKLKVQEAVHDSYEAVEVAESLLELQGGVSDESDRESAYREVTPSRYIIGEAGDGLHLLSDAESNTEALESASINSNLEIPDDRCESLSVHSGTSDADVSAYHAVAKTHMVIAISSDEDEIRTPAIRSKDKKRARTTLFRATPIDPSTSSESELEQPKKAKVILEDLVQRRRMKREKSRFM